MTPKELEEKLEDESVKLKDEMAEWERFYARFKPRLDEISGYEARIRELEMELEKRDSVLRLNLEKDKYMFALITVSFVVATFFFIRILTKFSNPWVFFGGGLLVGAGFAYLSRYWLNIV